MPSVWRRILNFLNDATAFEETDKRTAQAQQRRYAELEARLKKKDNVIAEIMENLINEKKDLGGFEVRSAIRTLRPGNDQRHPASTPRYEYQREIADRVRILPATQRSAPATSLNDVFSSTTIGHPRSG